jgi:hypothetical protein
MAKTLVRAPGVVDLAIVDRLVREGRNVEEHGQEVVVQRVADFDYPPA